MSSSVAELKQRPTILHIRRRAIARLIARYVECPEPSLAHLVRIRTLQDMSKHLRRKPNDVSDPLAWVDGWRPPLAPRE